MTAILDDALYPPTSELTGMSSNEQRALLRKRLAASPLWTDYAVAMGLTLSSLGAAEATEAADQLNVDWRDLDKMVKARAKADEKENNNNPKAAKPKPPVPPKAPELTAPDPIWPATSELPTAAPAAPAPAPAPEAPEQALALLKTLLGGNGSDPELANRIDALEKALAESHLTLVNDLQNVAGDFGGKIGRLESQIGELEAPQPRVIVRHPEGEQIGELPEVRHKSLEALLKACATRDASGSSLNVWLSGPAGSGKTKAATQVAEALGLTFGFHGAMTFEHQLMGYMDAAGNYHPTQFVTLYENGGLCLLDEVDAGANEPLLALNGALANGMLSRPDNKIIQRHPDFVCIAAGNTWGQGATAEYIGRAKLDAAFLDRFPVKIDWGYDEKLERLLSGNNDWARRVQKARKAAIKHGLKVVITPRATIAGAALIASGHTPDEAAALTYLASLTPEQVNMVEGV